MEEEIDVIKEANEAENISKKKLAVRISLTVLSSVLILYLIVFVIFQVFFPQSSINVLGYRLYLISYTKSMEPKFEYNDLIVVVKYDFDDLKEGDIITFMSSINGKEGLHPVTHRIEEIAIDFETGEKFIKTKGINLPLPDVTPVTKNGINGTNKYVGKYAFKSTFFGHIFAFFKTAQGLITVVVNSACIIGIYFVVTKMGKKEQADLIEKESDDMTD